MISSSRILLSDLAFYHAIRATGPATPTGIEAGQYGVAAQRAYPLLNCRHQALCCYRGMASGRSTVMFNGTPRTLAVGLLCAAAWGCDTTRAPDPAGAMLPAETLKALFMSGEVTIAQGSWNDNGESWELVRDGNGKQEITLESDGTIDRGTYRLDRNRVCDTWQQLWDGEERCAAYMQKPDGTYEAINAGGDVTAVFEIVDRT
jgi:hypothetical protein